MNPEHLEKIRQSAFRRRIQINAHAHELIKYFYTMERTTKLSQLSSELGIGLNKIYSYAVENGWQIKNQKPQYWTEKELEILRRNAQYSISYVKKILKKYGYNRTLSSIKAQLDKRKIKKSLDGQNAEELAACFGVSQPTIVRWINLGYLNATKRGITNKAHRDKYWITDTNIKKFIKDCIDIIDFHKVDKYWIVGLLTDLSIKISTRPARKYNDKTRNIFMEKING